MTLEQLEQTRSERKDEGDLPNSTTHNEAAAYCAHTATLDGRILRARDAVATLLDLEPKLVPDMRWRADLTLWRDQFCKALLAMKPGDRSREAMELQNGLRLSITVIDRGCGTWPNGAVMLGGPLVDVITATGAYFQAERPGVPWFGSMPEVEHRIADMQKRLATAQAQLDEALLDDDARAARDAESQARRDKLNTTPVRKTRGDGSQFDRWPDGRVVEITS